jgi:hypothetical protein
MKHADINITLIEGYLRLPDNLNPGNKLDLISKLSQSVKNDTGEKKSKFYKSFGAWDKKQSAEEIITGIQSNRTFNQQTGI